MANTSTTLGLAAVVGLAAGMAGSWAFDRYSGEDSSYQSVHPPIAVIDYTQAAQASGASVDEVMDDLDKKAARLKAAGFLVINRNALVAYPAGLSIHWTGPVQGSEQETVDGQ